MLAAHQLLTEVIISLRQVIAPAVVEPYPRAQAYMAAVLLEFIARQVDERGDIAVQKQAALDALFAGLSAGPVPELLEPGEPPDEAHLCRVIERLYAARQRLDPAIYDELQGRILATLRLLLDADLQVAAPVAR